MNNKVKLYVNFFTTSTPFSKKKKKKEVPNTGYLDIVKIAKTIGIEYCMALMLLHAYSGCDYTTSCYNIGKTKWYDEYNKRDNVKAVFRHVCEYPESLSETEVVAITRFTLHAYGVDV